MKGKREEMNSKYDTSMEEDLEKTKQRFYKKLQQVKDEGLDDDFVKELGKKIIKLEDMDFMELHTDMFHEGLMRY